MLDKSQLIKYKFVSNSSIDGVFYNINMTVLSFMKNKNINDVILKKSYLYITV